MHRLANYPLPKLDADDHETAIKLNQVISRQKANQLAEKAAKSGQGREWTLETDHGQTIWQVDVVDGHQKTEVSIKTKQSRSPLFLKVALKF